MCLEKKDSGELKLLRATMVREVGSPDLNLIGKKEVSTLWWLRRFCQ